MFKKKSIVVAALLPILSSLSLADDKTKEKKEMEQQFIKNHVLFVTLQIF